MAAEEQCPQCEQPLPKSEEWKRRRFRWGMLLAVLTFLPTFVFWFVNAYQSISAAKTTGLGAVAGGFSESATMFGMVALVASAVIGITLLVRGMSPGNTQRNAISIVGIVWFGFLLVTTVGGVVLSLFLSRMHR